MSTQSSTPKASFVTRASPGNSIWYGSALISVLTTGEMNGGRYSMLAWRLGKGYAPPPHRHGLEDFHIIRGRLRFWVAGEELIAEDGDLVCVPPNVWHTLQVESDEAEFTTIFSPPGMEGFFLELGSAASAMELPAGRVGPPDLSRARELAPKYGIEVSAPGSMAQDFGKPPK